MQVGEPDGFWTHWTNVEWVVAGILAAGVTIATFVWRLSLKIMILENTFDSRERADQVREEATQRRHEENVNVARGLQMQMMQLSQRIDRLRDSRNIT